MDHRMLPGLFFSLFCTGVCAQSTVAPVAQHPRLPGDTQSGVTDKVQFHFKDGDGPGTRWARQMGQGVARIVAQRRGMTNNTVVQYEQPDVECKVSPMKPGCP